MVNGVQQWMIQRFANASFVLFGIVALIVLASGNEGLTYSALTDLFDQLWLKLFLALVLILVFVNSWIAGWQIAGDYAKKFGIPNGVITWTAVLVSALYLIYGFKLIF